MQMDGVVSLPTNPGLDSLLVLNMKYHTISLMQINQDNPLILAPLFPLPQMTIPETGTESTMTIPETGTESTEPTLLTRAKVVDKVDVWKLDLLLHEYQIPQHSDLREAGRRGQVCNRDMTTQ